MVVQAHHVKNKVAVAILYNYLFSRVIKTSQILKHSHNFTLGHILNLSPKRLIISQKCQHLKSEPLTFFFKFC